MLLRVPLRLISSLPRRPNINLFTTKLQPRPSFHSKALTMASIYTDATPDEVKNAKGVHLLTFATPNGKPPQILLEELADAYGFDFTHSIVHIGKGVQKEEWFLRINPNNKIPALVDNSQSPPLAIIESSAQLLYLLDLVDKDHKFSFADPAEKSEMLQWLFFWHGGGGPIVGQLFFFGKMNPEKVPQAIDRFRTETLRIFGAMEAHLSGKYTGQPREYFAGKGKGKYSVADIKSWPWVSAWKLLEQYDDKDMEAFPHLLKWVDRIAERPAVQRGIGDKYAP